MFTWFTRRANQRAKQTLKNGQEDPDRHGPSVDIIFLDEDEHDETDTFFRTPVIPRIGESITLDGYFERRGTFVVECVEYTFCCESRQAGWARDVGVHINLFVR